jgi:hypothetical protein
LFDRDRWADEVVLGRSASFCMKRRNVGHKGRQLITYLLSCGTWTCLTCAIYTVYQHLHHLATLLDDCDEVFVATTTDSNWETFQKAMRRNRQNGGDWWVAARHPNGRRYVVGSGPKPNSDAGACTSVTPGEAWFWAQRAMALPGLALGRKGPIRWSRGDEPPDPPKFSSLDNLWGPLIGNEVSRAESKIHARLLDEVGPDYTGADLHRIGKEVVDEIVLNRGGLTI